MKKQILALAVAIISAGSFSIYAADGNGRKDDCVKDQCDGRQCDSRETQCRKDRKCPNPFEGLNLTADQQTKLKELMAAECPVKKDSAKCDGTQKRQRREAKAADRRQAKREFLAKVKEILTPEQYVTFLENSFSDSPRRDKAHHPGQRGDRRGNNHAGRR